MKRLCFLFLLIITHLSYAQNYFDESVSCFDSKIRISDEKLSRLKVAYPGDGNIDVKYYFLDINLEPSTMYLKGSVQIDFLPLVENLSEVSLDLDDAYTVDSVIYEGEGLDFIKESSQIKISFPTFIALNAAPVSLKVYYQGTTPDTNLRDNYGLAYTTHGNNEPVVWTLSEPYDAPLWWPCVDNPADKADSCDVWLTLPSFYTSVSQGTLVDLIENNDGTNTAKWKHRYPIAHYLISIAASNYVLLERSFTYGETAKMPVLDYVYPEIANDSRLAPFLDETLEMLSVFSDAFGEYPFIKEKYGHAMFGFGGGMEHQTISSMGTFTSSLIAHELAHQWFGDKVTCKTWRDIWINEAFAEFGSYYFVEKSEGKAAYNSEVSLAMNGSKFVKGTVAIENTNSVNEIFNFSKTYQKGSVVVHMLRGVLGDDVFFKTLKEFQNTEFSYGNASIEDFKAVAERVSSEDLTYFFDEWLFGTGYPRYVFGWEQAENNTAMISISHTGTEDTETFAMPIELKLNFKDGSNRIEKFFVDTNLMILSLDKLEGELSSIDFDPNNLILKDLSQGAFVSALSTQEQINFSLYPNPTEELLRFSTSGESGYSFEIHNTNGKRMGAGQTDVPLNVKYLPSGRYFIRFKNDKNNVFVKSFIKN
ncbi:M1 family aminopeptidase [Arcticibacterium luteifluviistationis]|uniref:Aminopeptidase N n=1 Tax=Arcticibacterium luteifluviistationis TaxID=1784714 RepID=A0A2Z4GDD8_9BACT|nr:M1 family aminopeptidase [Arcticibacterium luteifluviistationis]AWV99256.1 peptidase M1 [Arcticibacterium luteifluviistationis]